MNPMNELKTLNQVVTMNSREIAELVEKRHDNVMRDCRVLIEQLSANSNLSWHCKSTTYIDAQGKEREMFELDKNTTMTLIAGYNAILRMKIIKRWQELESKEIKVLSPSELLIQQAILLDQHIKATEKLAKQQAEQELRLNAIEAKMDASTGYMTIKAFCKMNKIHCPLHLAKYYGKDLTKLCKERKLPIGSVSDEVFGTVNSYPIHLMEEYFELQIK